MHWLNDERLKALPSDHRIQVLKAISILIFEGGFGVVSQERMEQVFGELCQSTNAEVESLAMDLFAAHLLESSQA